MITLTPYGGLDFTGVSATSSILDFRPDRTYGETLTRPLARLEDTAVYSKALPSATTSHHRFYGGVRFIGGVLQLGAEVSYTRLGSVDVPTGADPAVTESKRPPRRRHLQHHVRPGLLGLTRRAGPRAGRGAGW